MRKGKANVNFHSELYEEGVDRPDRGSQATNQYDMLSSNTLCAPRGIGMLPSCPPPYHVSISEYSKAVQEIVGEHILRHHS
jgi:hypothetical protein